MLQAIIFDLDGTLIESDPHHHNIEAEVMRAFGVEMDPELLKEYAGTRFEEEFQDFIERFGLKVSVHEILKKHRKIAEKYYREVFPAMPGAAETLATLSKKYPLALATGSPKGLAEIVLERLGILKYFDERVFMEDVTKGKPDPAPFLLAAKKLKIPKENSIVIEDSLKGFRSAKAAGMKLIALKVHHNKDLDFSLADRVIENLAEIPEIIEELKIL